MKGDPHFTLELPSQLESIEHVVDRLVEHCRRAGFDEERIRLNFRVGVAEAIANAMLYGNRTDPGKRVRVEARFAPESVIVRISDEGGGFDPAALPDPTLPTNRTLERGRGVFLIRKLMDRVEFNEEGNSITMELRAAAEQAPATAPAAPPRDHGPAPTQVLEIIRAYERSHPETRLRLWRRGDDGAWAFLGPEPAARVEPGPDAVPLGGMDGEYTLDVHGRKPAPADLDFLVDAVSHVMRYDGEARSAARELSERYEEITLLYSISEILASVISFDAAARRILEEVADVLGARRAALWVHDAETKRLVLAAGVGQGERSRKAIRVDDPASVTARVFRERQPVNLERGVPLASDADEPRPAEQDAYLSVPMNFTPPDGPAKTVGVITLVGQRFGVRFTAGDTQLLTAVASQVGAALETHRLVRESVRRERVEHELELAHDLQLKLLPDAAQFADYADVAARCVPAESVGGDLYNLFHLSDGRIGVVMGDVSSHGFSAALIMALTMSAIAIYAQEADPPGEVLRRVHHALIDELESTEMYLTLVYAVIDPGAGTLVYANAGHPHAFRVLQDGTVERLTATSPPLGTFPLPVHGEAATTWNRGDDLLVLFTDGLSDAFSGAAGIDGEQRLLDQIVRQKDDEPAAILDRLFRDTEGADLGVPPDDRTAVILRA